MRGMVILAGMLLLGCVLPVACRPDRESESGTASSNSPTDSSPTLRARLGLGHPVVVDAVVDRPRVIRLEPFTLSLTIYVRDLPHPWRGSDPFSVQTWGAEPVLTIPWLVPPAGLESRDAGEWLQQQYLSFVRGPADPRSPRRVTSRPERWPAARLFFLQPLADNPHLGNNIA